jgi:phosphomannomutase
MTAKHKFDASVMITASHNSKEYNGFKVSKTNALPVGYDTGLKKLEEMVENQEIKISDNKGKVIDYDVKEEYLNFLRKYKSDISNLKIGIDCSNGMAALLIKDILGNLPLYIYDTLDGTFPNHEANPLVQKNVEDLKKHVIKNKCDIGVIYDGDADRVMFVDEKGKFISPDLMIAVMANYFLVNGKKENVLQDIRSSKAVKKYIEKFGGKMYMWRVGRAYASIKLREINGLFGGELAGHYYFRDFYYSDSGILASLIILNIISKMKRKSIPISKLIAEISSYSNSGEINFRIENKKQAMEKIKDYFMSKENPTAFYDFDGYRIEFNDWWFNIRPSNTEPYLRLLVEANNDKLLKEKITTIKSLIEKFV